jgi:hypothetical protein
VAQQGFNRGQAINAAFVSREGIPVREVQAHQGEADGGNNQEAGQEGELNQGGNQGQNIERISQPISPFCRSSKPITPSSNKSMPELVWVSPLGVFHKPAPLD